jgi:hypothetical protein
LIFLEAGDRTAGDDRPTLVESQRDDAEANRGGEPEQGESRAAGSFQQAVAEEARPHDPSQPSLSTPVVHLYGHRTQVSRAKGAGTENPNIDSSIR